MNKMTDKEIIQTLEKCSSSNCDDCYYCNAGIPCLNFYRHARDLISRQQKEIEGLQKTIENRNEADRIALEAYEQLLYEVDYQQTEIERLKRQENIYGNMLADAWKRIEELDKINETAKTEAIKEFVERLIENKYYTGNPTGYGTYAVMVDTINKIAEKMMEANNG